MEANLFVLNPVSLVYEFEQTGVEKALRLETQRQNVMTNPVQWISQKKETELLLCEWGACGGIRIVRAMKKRPSGSSRKISIPVHLESCSTIITYYYKQIKVVVLGYSGSEAHV